jgi:alpha-ketoglutarate-dependent taurine dioxygenase
MNIPDTKPKGLPLVRRKSIHPSPVEWADIRPLRADVTLPLAVTPAAPDISLHDWIAERWSAVEPRLLEHGALLFRGFHVDSAGALDRFVGAVSSGALAYEERSSPRSQVQGNIYTSTDHPPDHPIFLHNEQSYNLTFPLRLFFACATPAREGGETPIADSRRIFRRIDPEIRRRFVDKKYLYARSFGGRLGLSWQAAFQTTDRACVEDYCRRNAISFEWREGDRLRTRQVREPVARHPVTGELSWFNHATFFHVSTLPRAIRDALLGSVAEDDLPNNTYYGDGSPIEPAILDALRAAYEEETVSFPWQKGDLLLIDNMLAAHGRAPYAGPRLTLAAMSTPTRWEQCLHQGIEA